MTIPIPLKNFLAYKSTLSRVGFVLVGIWVFLALVSYAKGIQIMIFIPALVLALFLFSYWEIFRIRKGIRAYGIREKDGYSLVLRGERGRDFGFRIGISDERGIAMLVPEGSGIRFIIPRELSGKIIVFFTGSFDLVRHVIPLIAIDHRADDGMTNRRISDSDGDFSIFVKPYETGDRTNRIDSIKSSVRNSPFVKAIEHYETGNEHRNPERKDREIRVESSLPLVRKNDLKRAGFIHGLLILLNLAVISVQWGNPLMSGFLIFTIAIVAILGKTGKIPPGKGTKYRNSTLIWLFLVMLSFTKIEGNMGLPGSVFLTQILVVKKLFPDAREDGFLYIFLSLFVFVAVAITSTELWFVLFFLAYLVLAILLLSTVSGYGYDEPINASIGTRIRTSSYLRSLFVILFLMVGLFFVIPHGEAVERNSTFTAQKSGETLSGFGNEINLQNVSGIKRDLSKKIVVTGIGESQAEELRSYYWRGNRYTEFRGDKWENPGFVAQKSIAVSASGSANIQGLGWNSKTRNYDIGTGAALSESEILEHLKITYYTLGTKNLFFPKTPHAFAFSDRSDVLNLSVSAKDDSLYALSPAPNAPIALDVSVKRSKDTNALLDARAAFSPFKIKIDPEKERLFQKFWDSLDPKLHNNPSWLALYIKNRAGFAYSIDEPALSLESFLYGTKRGHCEYFATVLTLTLQRFGHQATIVNGFHGGEWNDLAQALVIQGQDAHAWTEVYDTQKNTWLVLDATPTASAVSDAISWTRLKKTFGKAYDYLDISWYTYVANFSGSAQRELFGKTVPYLPFVFLPVIFALLYRPSLSGYRKARTYLAEDYETRLIRFLGGKKNAKFALLEYRSRYPELVDRTRKKLYGEGKMPKTEYGKLLSEWKTVYGKNL